MVYGSIWGGFNNESTISNVMAAEGGYSALEFDGNILVDRYMPAGYCVGRNYNDLGIISRADLQFYGKKTVRVYRVPNKAAYVKHRHIC